MPHPRDAERIAAAALAEDGPGDLTTELTVSPEIQADGVIETRSAGIFAGTAYADAVARACHCTVRWQARDGEQISPRQALGTIIGPLREILRGERPLLNLLQRATGIATATRQFVDAVAGTRCRILHTRKTAPGLRALDVASVVAGGGEPHRLDLAHEIMVKDNHWRALERERLSLRHVLDEARRRGIRAIYVEVESEPQLDEACDAGATRLLIDNQSPSTLRSWGDRARRKRPGIEIEATGGITLENVRGYAEAGADFISIGALTHSVRAADIALEVKLQDRAADERR